VESTIHLRDGTKIEVKLKNNRYEGCGVVNEEGGYRRGYKLATLRGMIEEIRLGSINEHDLEVSREMIRGSGGHPDQ
jgi:hypothetical protein